MKLMLSAIESPLGKLTLVTDLQDQVHALTFADHPSRRHRNLPGHYGPCVLAEAPAPTPIAAALSSYFGGDLTALDAIVTATEGTLLQRRVWAALRSIPAGETTSYGDLARTLGYLDPRTAIDVGAANGANPIAIIVPCHRVIAKNGELKGYAWGLHRKRWLLAHEGARVLTAPLEKNIPQTMPLPGL
jgi:methylated-DNA-[protein]-cysteine S-methyltransferase